MIPTDKVQEMQFGMTEMVRLCQADVSRSDGGWK